MKQRPKARSVVPAPGESPRGDHRLLPALTAALVAAGVLSPDARAQVQSAGDLLVSIDATALAEGPLATIPNTGTLGGLFEATGAAADSTTVPVVATEGGTKGIRFDGNDYLQLVEAVGGNLILAPAGITGERPTRSIEVWALNPAIAAEETLVSWSHRGGPAGSNMSFNYGSDFRWGAVGHWDSPDLGWDNNGGAPTAGLWHHLVYTHDGNTTRVYADGVLANFEDLDERILNSYPDTAINIGTQLQADGVTPDGGQRATATIARVRIHDGVLTAEQVLSNYNAEKAAFIDPELPPPPGPPVAERLPKGPVHRYSFSEAAGAAAQGAEIRDSVGTAHGTIQGDGANHTGTRISLPGGSSAEAAYVDLPNGLVSAHGAANGGSGQFTFETWLRITGTHNWSRVIDFGSTTTEDGSGELFGPGLGGEGLDYLVYSAMIGTDVGNRRLEVRNDDPAGGGTATLDLPTATYNTDTHVVITWNEATEQVTLYENGLQRGVLTAPGDRLSDINDVNVWLGRSNWTADSNTQGEYDEARFYDVVLTPGQVLGNYYAGPDALATPGGTDIPVTLTAQPQNASAQVGGSANFSVGINGTAPVSVQWFRNGTAIPGAISPTYTVSPVQSADHGAQFTAEVSNTAGGNPVKVTSQAGTLNVVTDTTALKHRYSFNETGGFTVSDSVGNANGDLFGNATFQGGQLILDGTVDTFADLPNGILSGLGENGTIEMWITYTGSAGNWSRLFDFGISDAGEGEAGGGVDFFFLTPRTGDGVTRFEGNTPTAAVGINTPNLPIGQEVHVVIAYSHTGNATRIYMNGVQVAQTTSAGPLSSMVDRDVNNWLGRSQFSADAYCAARFNELRLHSGAMTLEQIAASYQAGPNALPVARPTLEIARDGANVRITFTGSLEAADAVTGPYSAVAGATSPAVIPANAAQKYYRARQ